MMRAVKDPMIIKPMDPPMAAAGNRDELDSARYSTKQQYLCPSSHFLKLCNLFTTVFLPIFNVLTQVLTQSLPPFRSTQR